jgi:hypothetical protein
MVNARPPLRLIAPSATLEEAAAIVAALERFRRDTAPRRRAANESPNAWLSAAILEGVSGGQEEAVSDPWINT